MADADRGLATSWGRVFRLSLAPSAIADAVAGILLGAGHWPAGSGVGWLLLASACTYHGGMALNDWADRERDAQLRPDRPIPSGAVSARAVAAVAVMLLAAGPALAWSVAPVAGLAMGATALLAAAYDLVLRGPISGPLALAGCRAGNVGAAALGAGAYALPGWEPRVAATGIALYGLYVFWVSRLGTFEDLAADEDLGTRPNVYARAAGVLLAAYPVILWNVAPPALRSGGTLLALAVVISLQAAWPVLRRSARPLRSSRDVLPLMGACLRRLLIVTCTACLVVPAAEAPWIAAALLAGYPASYLLRVVFPPS